MSDPKQNIPCPACGAINRLDPARGLKTAKCGKCGSPLARSAAPLEVTDADFQEKVLASPLPVLLDLWAPWCGPCRTVGPIIEELAEKYHGRLRAAKMNVDDNPYTARELRVSSIPTLLFYKGGNEVNRLVGAHPRATIEQSLAMIL